MICPTLIIAGCLYLLSHLTASLYTRLPNSFGHTSTIYKLSNDTTPLVCKSIHPQYADTLFPIEQKVYERFTVNNPPQSLLTFHGVHSDIPSGLVLEHAESGNLQDWIFSRASRGIEPAPSELLYKWAFQATEALQFAHGLGVLHSDIHCLNFFLTRDLDLKVGDWAGASVDGEKSYCSYRYSHRLFGADGTDIVAESGVSVDTEIFALGTALYVMITGEEPWPELEEPEDREEIKRRIAGKLFPPTAKLRVLGDVVDACWKGGFASMREVRGAVQDEWHTSTSNCDR